MSRPFRVLHVLSGLGVGGAETWLMEVLRLWKRNGAGRIDFLLTGGKSDVFDAEAAELGARLHYLRYGRGHLRSFVAGFRHLLAMGHYDAIHDHSDYAAGWHFAMGKGLLPPVRIAHVHNPWLHIKANYAISPVRRLSTFGGKILVKELASHVVGTSAEILRQYGFRMGQDSRLRVEVVHCGIDVARFNAPREQDRARILSEYGWPLDTKLVLFAGRLDRALEIVHPQNHKNSWLALNIVRDATVRDPRIRLIMAGEGSSRAQLNEAVRQWGLAERLRLTGIRLDVPALMRASDVLLFPSAQEGLGMVAVEAQAAGLPVLASDVVPREAVVVPELYEALPLDAPIHIWADRLIASANRPRMDRTGCAAALEASDFSLSRSAKKLERIYRQELAHVVEK